MRFLHRNYTFTSMCSYSWS